MRAVSILIVVVAHVINPATHPKLSATLGHIGNYGVRIFFLISGFLITGLLLKEYDRTGTISLKAFYLRRAIRIFPAFYVYVGVIWLLVLFSVIHVSQADFLSAITYTMNYHADHGWYLNHTWSLAVEEQFYLLWPALFLFARPAKALRYAGLAIILIPILRAVLYLGFHASDSILSRHFETVSDALATGCLLAGFYNRLKDFSVYLRLQASTFYVVIPLLLLLLSALTFLVHPALYYIVGQSIANIGGVLLLDYVVRLPHSPLGRLLNIKPMVIIGFWSYSIYLWQELMLDIEPGGLNIPWPFNFLSVFLVAAASYYLVEQQFLKLRKYVARHEAAAATF